VVAAPVVVQQFRELVVWVAAVTPLILELQILVAAAAVARLVPQATAVPV
jgi:hypothetical protein